MTTLLEIKHEKDSGLIWVDLGDRFRRELLEKMANGNAIELEKKVQDAVLSSVSAFNFEEEINKAVVGALSSGIQRSMRSYFGPGGSGGRAVRKHVESVLDDTLKKLED